ncbi:MAG: hypothetical protein K6L73_12380 [Cellvibrionaceae bacterium]
MRNQKLCKLILILGALAATHASAQTIEGETDPYANMARNLPPDTMNEEFKPPLKQRMEQSISKFLTKESVGDAIVAGTLASAASAHPAGALVGGILGALYDKVVKGAREKKQEHGVNSEAIRLAEEAALTELLNFEEQERQKHLAELNKAVDCYGGAEANKTFVRTRKNLNHCFYYAGSLER